MTVLILRSSASQGGGGAPGVTFDSGYDGSGTFGDGEDFTITSSGLFPSKAHARPLLYAEGNSTTLNSTFSRTGTLVSQGGTTIAQTSVKPTGSAGAFRTRACDSGTNGGTAPIVLSGLSFNASQLYVYVKRYWDHTADPQNLKMIRAWQASVGSAPDFYSAIGVQANSFVEGVADDIYPTDGSHFHNQAFNGQQWRIWEHFFTESSLNTYNGLIQLADNGRLFYPSSQRWCTRSTNYTQSLTQLYLDEYSNESSLDSLDYHANMYIDETPLRLWLSDESSFSISTSVEHLREIQLPHTTWTTSEIIFRVRQGQLGSLSGKCLWLGTDHYSATRILTVD